MMAQMRTIGLILLCVTSVSSQDDSTGGTEVTTVAPATPIPECADQMDENACDLQSHCIWNFVIAFGTDGIGYPTNEVCGPLPGYETDFESHSEGDYICAVDDNFAIWPGGTVGGYMDVQVQTPPGGNSKALRIVRSPTSDVVLPFNQLIGESGEHLTVEMDMMILPGKNAYMNFQGNVQIGTSWAINLYFNTGTLTFSGKSFQAPHPVGEYFNLRLEADYTAGTWEVFIDGISQGGFQMTTPVASINFYARSNDEYYVDNVKWEFVPASWPPPPTCDSVVGCDACLHFTSGTDATCTGADTPAACRADGGEWCGPELCRPDGSNCSYGDGFSAVELGPLTQVQSPTCTPGGYSDFTDTVIDLEQGSAYPISLTTGYGNQWVRGWLDCNDDLTLDPTSELVLPSFEIADGQGSGTHVGSSTLTVPADCPLGEHVLRLKANWSREVPTDACETTTWGETEDFTVNVFLLPECVPFADFTKQDASTPDECEDVAQALGYFFSGHNCVPLMYDLCEKNGCVCNAATQSCEWSATCEGCSDDPGDYNDDGVKNVLDVAGATTYILSMGTAPGMGDCEELGMDYNGDGSVNVLDVVALVAYILWQMNQQQ